jgi:hypothetical protein
MSQPSTKGLRKAATQARAQVDQMQCQQIPIYACCGAADIADIGLEAHHWARGIFTVVPLSSVCTALAGKFGRQPADCQQRCIGAKCTKYSRTCCVPPRETCAMPSHDEHNIVCDLCEGGCKCDARDLCNLIYPRPGVALARCKPTALLENAAAKLLQTCRQPGGECTGHCMSPLRQNSEDAEAKTRGTYQPRSKEGFT